MASRANPYGVTTALRATPLQKINPQIITDCVTLGLGWVRIMILWTSIELQKGVYDSNALDVLDDAVHRCNQAGLHVQFPIQQPPAWHLVATNCAVGATNGAWYMPDPTSVANFASFLSKRYNGVTNVPNYGTLTIDAFEIGNEEYDNHFSAGQPITVGGQQCRDAKWFIPCLKAASPVIRANNPGALVGMNSLWWAFSDHHVSFMSELYAANCGPFFDYANVHVYSSPISPDQNVSSTNLSMSGQVTEIWNVMNANGDGAKNVWVTEWGAPANVEGLTGDMTDAARVTWMNTGLDQMRTNGHVGVGNWYTMNYTNPTINPKSPTYSLTLYNTPHYTQTFSGYQAYITKYPPSAWSSGGGGTGGGGTGGGGTGGGGTSGIALSTNALAFSGAEGGTNPGNQTITITNLSGGSSAPYTATKTQSWLTVSPGSGTIAAAGTATSTVSIDLTGLAAGSYSDTITYSASNTITVAISLTVTPTGAATNLITYFTGTAASTIATANLLYTTGGGAANVNNASALGSATGYGELYSQGTASAWGATGTAPAPSGHGFLLDSTLLESYDLIAGQYTAAVRLNTTGAGAVNITADIHARMYRRRSNGTYISIADAVLTNQTIKTTKTTFAPVFTTSSPTSFLTGDKLYIDILLNVLTNSGPSTLTVTLSDLSNETGTLTGLSTANVATPGYQQTPGGGGGTGAGVTALSVYGSNSAASTIGTSGKLDSTAGGTDAAVATKLGTATGYSELYALGTASAWAAGGSIGAPSGNGFLWDVVTLESNEIVAGLWAPAVNLSLSATGVGNTALTAYFTGTAASTIGTANLLYQASGGTANINTATKLGTATGYGEVFSQGTTGAWAAGGSAPAPSGHGFLLDSTLLESNQLAAGAYTASVRLNTTGTGAVNITADIHCRVYKRSSGGTYTSIADTVLTGQSIKTSKTVFNPTFTTSSVTTFTTGDKLYLDIILNVTANTGASTQNITFSDLSTETGTLKGLTTAQLVTPGYQSSGGSSATITADIYTRAYVFNGSAYVYSGGAYGGGVYNGSAYTAIGSMVRTGATITGTAIVFHPTAASFGSISFNAGDKLYLDLWASVTANSNGLSGLNINVWLSTSGTTGVANDMQMDTPGYQASAGGPGRPPPGVQGPQANDVWIDNQPMTALAGTIFAQATIGKRATASFSVITDLNTHFEQYLPVQIYDANVNVAFNGYIAQVKETKPGFQDVLVHDIQCTDLHYLADKRILAASYTNRTCGYIVNDIFNTILAGEGVTIGLIYDGPTPSLTLYPSTTLYPGGNVGLIPQAIFAYCTVAAALDELVQSASAAGVPYYWMIDQAAQLWFAPYTAVVNSELVDGTRIEQGNQPPHVVRANPLYRNTQYILDGVQQTGTIVETRKGDSNTQSWTMGYQLAAFPVIKKNGATQSVAIKGGSGAQFYWAQGDPVITQDSGQTVLTSSDTLQVTYTGQYPTVIIDTNASQITYQGSVDNSTGIVEQVERDASVTSLTIGMQAASALLTRYAQQSSQFTFTTLDSGFGPGQLVTVDIPAFNYSTAQLLIENVTMSDQFDQFNLWYTVTAIAGPYDTTWVDFFSTLLKQTVVANSINLGVGASVPLSASFTASVSPTATLNVTVYACPIPNTTLHPATNLFPC